MPKRVLVVDDEDHIREVAQLSLEAVGGFDVLSAPSGAVALEAAARYKPDVILLDVMMPDQDGPTTFRLLRDGKETANIPVVFLTAKAQNDERQSLEQLGAVGVLAKPFDPMTLPQQVSDLVGWT